MELNPEDFLTSPHKTAYLQLENLSDNELHEIFIQNNAKIVNRIFDICDEKIFHRIINATSIDSLRSAIMFADDEAVKKLIRYAHPNQLSRLLHDSENELIHRLVDLAPSKPFRQAIVKALPIERRNSWQKYITSAEADAKNAKNLSQEATTSLLEERQRVIRDLELAIREKESLLRDFENESRSKQAHYEHQTSEAQRRLAQLQVSIAEHEARISARENDLKSREADFEEATKRQVQQRIEAKVPEFVAAAIKSLEDRESLYRKKASQWSIHGTLVLILSIIATAAISLFGSGIGGSIKDLEWQTLVFVSFKGLVVLGVLGLWAKHAFTVSNAYMHEAIKRSDRVHAISFGKLYLEIYGNNIDRKELIEIFEDWNIASESAFLKANPNSFEPKILDKLTEVVKSIDGPVTKKP